MKSVHITKLTLLLLCLLPGLGCGFATFSDPGPSNFVSNGNGYNNSLEQTRPRGLTARTKDGRTVLLNEGTWEYTSSLPVTSTSATLANGQRVLLRSNGSWAYLASSPIRPKRPLMRPTPIPIPPPASFLHFYQLGGGSGQATIFLDGAPIANLRERRYFSIQVVPGLHVFSIFNSGKGQLALTTVNGMHYYLRNSDTFGPWREKLTIVDVTVFNRDLPRLTPLSGADVLRLDLVR